VFDELCCLIDTVQCDDWSTEAARAGLGRLGLVQRKLDALMLRLVGRLGAGRDTAAAVARTMGVSGAAGKHVARVSRVVEQIPSAADLLASGELSTAHLEALGGLEIEQIVSLLPLAASQSVDDFRRTVARARVDASGSSVRERQLAERSVRYSKTENHSSRITITLPELEGAEFRNSLAAACDRAYRAAHPERATTLGGHHVAPLDQRLADTFIEWMRGNQTGGLVGRPAVVVTVDLDTMQATLLPDTPIGLAETAELVSRADIYSLMWNHTIDAELRFGRTRRLASSLQRLLLSVLHPRCVVDGCEIPTSHCEIDHRTAFSHGGDTDIENLEPRCPPHHHHKDDHLTSPHRGHDPPRTHTSTGAQPTT
jgi:hypothetical protein